MAVDKVPLTHRGSLLNFVVLLVSIFTVVVLTSHASMANAESSLNGKAKNMQSDGGSSVGDSSMGISGHSRLGVKSSPSKSHEVDQDNKHKTTDVGIFLPSWPTTPTPSGVSYTVSTSSVAVRATIGSSGNPTETSTATVNEETVEENKNIVQGEFPIG